MPNIGYYHPIVIHFAIAFLAAGVVLRLLSLTGRLRFASPAAAALLLLGTLAAVASVRSGTDAHGPAERVPGARDAVVEHEELGERARNVFLLVAVLEIAALALARRKREKFAQFASAAVGIVGLYFLFEAAEHGGELVYSYAGGIGVRTGEEEDVERLLLAGLYHQSQLDRKNGRSDDAAVLIELAARRHPEDAEIQLLAAESLILDRKAPEQALEALASIEIPSANARLRIRRGILEADAYEAAGDGSKARAALEALLSEFPDNARLKRRLEELD
jgi:uncharacterized membrane protein